jgi:UDP-N-acetylmuramoylalanine--D-glutamate ligase
VDLSAYYNTKLNLLRHTEGPIVCNQNGGDLKESITLNPAAASIYQKIIWCHRHDLNMQKYHIQSCNMVGTHNLDNLAVALQVGLLCQWPTSFIKSLLEFSGLPHRLENLGHYDFADIRNIQFINDSKSTTMNSVLEAVESVLPNVPKQSNLVLLLGGKDKNLPWSQLSVLGKHSNIRFLFFGSVANTAKEQSALDGSTYTSLNEAMSNLRKHLTTNDIVLLSPGGTSLDEFKNFEERGDFFKKKITSI